MTSTSTPAMPTMSRPYSTAEAPRSVLWLVKCLLHVHNRGWRLREPAAAIFPPN